MAPEIILQVSEDAGLYTVNYYDRQYALLTPVCADVLRPSWCEDGYRLARCAIGFSFEARELPPEYKPPPPRRRVSTALGLRRPSA